MPQSCYVLQGKVAVVTGAASGIGAALARALSAQGCKLALADWNETGLRSVAAALPGEVMAEKLDVSDRAAVFAFADRVKARFGVVHVVINNAGVAVSQNVAQHSIEDYEWIMGINFWGVLYGSKAFLPMMQAQKEGVIVNISSVFGLIGAANQSGYCAAKFGVRGFTESLRWELELARAYDRHFDVHALLVHPGGVKTNIVNSSRFHMSYDGKTDKAAVNAQFQKMATLTPETAAALIVEGIQKRSPRILLGSDARLLARLQRFFPVQYGRVLGLLLRLAPK